MSTNPDDLENFDDGQFDDLDTDAYDEPLADEIVDAESVADEEFGSDDDWDNPTAEGGDNQPQPQKKKSSFLTYIVIGAVVLVGGGFALMSLSGGEQPTAEIATADTSETPVPEAASLEGLRDEAMQQQDQPPTAPVAEGEAPPPTGFMNDAVAPPAPALGLPPGPALTAVDAPPPEEDSLPTVPATPAAEVPVDPAVIDGLRPVSDFPSVDLIKKSDAPPAPVVTSEASVAPTPQVSSAELTVLQGKLDAALGKVDILEKELTAAKSAPAPQADTSAFDAKIEELESTVSRLEKQLAAQKEASKSSSSPEIEVQVEPAAQREESVVPAEPVQERATPRPAPAKTAAWELRGAQPGKAMLALKGSSDDIRTVSVGDSLPGLGRILSIDQSQAGWVVRGTNGQVSQ